MCVRVCIRARALPTGSRRGDCGRPEFYSRAQFIKLHIGDRRRTATTVYTYLYKRCTKGSIPLAGERFNRNESLFPVYKNDDTGWLFPDARRRSPVARSARGTASCYAKPLSDRAQNALSETSPDRNVHAGFCPFTPTPPPTITEMCAEYKNIITCCVCSLCPIAVRTTLRPDRQRRRL